MPRDTGGTLQTLGEECLTRLRRHAASWRSGTGNQAAACDHPELLLFMERPGQGFKEGGVGENGLCQFETDIFVFSLFSVK